MHSPSFINILDGERSSLGLDRSPSNIKYLRSAAGAEQSKRRFLQRYQNNVSQNETRWSYFYIISSYSAKAAVLPAWTSCLDASPVPSSAASFPSGDLYAY